MQPSYKVDKTEEINEQINTHFPSLLIIKGSKYLSQSYKCFNIYIYLYS